MQCENGIQEKSQSPINVGGELLDVVIKLGTLHRMCSKLCTSCCTRQRETHIQLCPNQHALTESRASIVCAIDFCHDTFIHVQTGTSGRPVKADGWAGLTVVVHVIH